MMTDGETDVIFKEAGTGRIRKAIINKLTIAIHQLLRF